MANPMNPRNAPAKRPDVKPIAGRQTNAQQPGKPFIVQPKIAIASHAKKQPAAPPAYRPQPAPKAMQLKMAGGSQQHQPLTAVVQPKSGARPSTVIQCKNCVSCLHKAHAKDCTVQVPVAGASASSAAAATRACGCKSHSIKFDKSQKFNPGGGKHARMLANIKSGK